MLNRFRRMLKEKGQGLTEYVLILAFIAGIAFMMFGGNGSLKDTLVTTWTKTSSIIAGLFGEKVDWGKVNPNNFNDSNQAERYASDQKALENLANFFMDKSESEIKALLSGKNANGVTNTNDAIGWFVKDSNGNMHFLTKQLTPDSQGLKMSDAINAYSYSYNDKIFNWMQGDTGENGYNLSYTPSYNYLVSDYVTDQFNRTNYNWTRENFNNDTGGNGLKLKFHYDSQHKVDAVRVMIDQNSQDRSSGKTSSSYSSDHSNGLEVTLKRGGTPEYTNVGWNANLSGP